jgi:GNAT superfamily N-acetyltransferase
VTPRPARYAVVPLAPEHVLDSFTCGDTDIDTFLRNRARAEQGAGLSQVYVAASRTREVVAYFTLSPLTVRVEPALVATLGLGAAPYPAIGGFLLGRLGVASALQRRGMGRSLVMRAAQIAKREAAVVGGAFLAVDPKTDTLVRWYAGQEFVRLAEKTRRMVIPLRAVP